MEFEWKNWKFHGNSMESVGKIGIFHGKIGIPWKTGYFCGNTKQRFQ
jgi:hypothetical protein